MDGCGVNSQQFRNWQRSYPCSASVWWALPWGRSNAVAAPGTPDLSGGRMGLFIMCLQQVLAKTIGRIVPYAVHMIGPILRVIVLND
jgi:hypothetical protein